MSTDSWGVRLYQAIKRYLLPWPVCDTYLRVHPVDTDDEVRFYSDMRYFEDLSVAVLGDVHLARCEAPDYFLSEIARPRLQMVEIPVAGAQPEWPIDVAADLISLWRFDREYEAWCDGGEILGDEAA